MARNRKTVVGTGASQGIGAGRRPSSSSPRLRCCRNRANPGQIEGASLSMITKGGLNAVTRSLAMEYAKEHIRFNAVAPGVVDTPLHAEDPKNSLKTLSPMGSISTVEDIASAVVYLTEARQITGEVLHVDGGAHVGKW